MNLVNVYRCWRLWSDDDRSAGTQNVVFAYKDRPWALVGPPPGAAFSITSFFHGWILSVLPLAWPFFLLIAQYAHFERSKRSSCFKVSELRSIPAFYYTIPAGKKIGFPRCFAFRLGTDIFAANCKRLKFLLPILLLAAISVKPRKSIRCRGFKSLLPKDLKIKSPSHFMSA